MNRVSRSLSLFLLALAFAAPSAAAPPPLTDAALVKIASGYQANRWPPSGYRVLGRHHGVNVVAGTSCSDVCPGNTVTVIYYDVALGAACRAAGGTDATAFVPMSIAMVEKHFCVPQILVARKLFRFNP